MPPKQNGASTRSQKKSNKAEKSVVQPSEAEIAAQDHHDDDDEQSEYESAVDDYEDEEPVEFAPILDQDGTSSRLQDPWPVPPWHDDIFPEDDETWDFPAGVRKTGNLPTNFEITTEHLRQGMEGVHGEMRGRYEAYIGEWQVLRQSTVYGKLVASALAQINHTIKSKPQEARLDGNGDLPQRLEQLESIMATLLRAQTDRAAVLLAAAEYSLKAADTIESKLSVRNRGIPKHLIEEFKAFGPVSRRASGSNHSSTINKSSAWSASSKKQSTRSDAKPASLKKQHQSPPSPAKTSGGGGA